jgi:DNA-binding transcriptional LysR family regulator
MTQPPLSRQIQQLERELDTQLFVRTSRRVVLTEAGRVLLPHARQLLDLADRAAADTKAVGLGAEGSLSIAYTAMAGRSILPAIVKLVNKHLPGVRLNLTERITADQLDEIERGTVDIGLLHPQLNRPTITERTLLTEDMLVAVHTSSPYAASAEPIRLDALAREPLLMYQPKTARYFHDLSMLALQRAGIEPRISQYAGQIPVLLSLANAALGFAIVPASARHFLPEDVRLRPIDFEGMQVKPVQSTLSLAWNGGTTNPVVFRFLDVLEQDVGQEHSLIRATQLV